MCRRPLAIICSIAQKWKSIWKNAPNTPNQFGSKMKNASTRAEYVHVCLREKTNNLLLLVSDENFNNDIVRGLLRRNPALDVQSPLAHRCS